MAPRKMILLNPGPVNVSRKVKTAQLQPDICHREDDFSRLLRSIRKQLLQAFAPKGGFTSVLLSGSGTASLEAAVISAVPPEGRLLVVNNGVYGARIAQIATIHSIPIVELKYEWGQPPDTREIATALRRDPSVTTVALVHHETTTGLLNPVREVGHCVASEGRRFLVDSISGLGGEEIDLHECEIDLCVGTANKCIQGLPGVSFVLIREELLRELQRIPPRSLYLHLFSAWEMQEKGETPFTPAIPAFYAFEAALAELLQEGVKARIARYRRAAALLRAGFRRLGLRPLLPPELQSNTITALHLPEGFTYEALHDRLKAKRFVIYAGQGHLSPRIFRVANMGALSRRDFTAFLATLTTVLRQRG